MLWIGRECRTCPYPGAITAFPLHGFIEIIQCTVFSAAAIRVYRNEFVNFIHCFRCLVVNSCLLIGQFPCFDVSLGCCRRMQRYIRWSVVCSSLPQGHIALSGSLNRCSGFSVSGYYGSKVRGYFYLSLDSVRNAWEELFSQGGLWAFLPCFLPFYYCMSAVMNEWTYVIWFGEK
jgi:hypothetical protein